MFSRMRRKEKVELSALKRLSHIPKVGRSIKFLPDWYKKLPKMRDDMQGPTVKACLPFIDTMRMGVTIPLWADLEIVVSEHYIAYDEAGNVLDDSNAPLIEYPIGDKVDFRGLDYAGGVIDRFESKGLGTACRHPTGFFSEFFAPQRHAGFQIEGMRFSNGAPPMVWKLNSPWYIETPKGYSTLYKNPSNNFDNDLTVFEGLVDTDTYSNMAVQFPFFWTGKEKGVFHISRGTPIAQLIFIKRDSQNLDFSISTKEEDDSHAGASLLESKFFDRYRDLYWHKRKDK